MGWHLVWRQPAPSNRELGKEGGSRVGAALFGLPWVDIWSQEGVAFRSGALLPPCLGMGPTCAPKWGLVRGTQGTYVSLHCDHRPVRYFKARHGLEVLRPCNLFLVAGSFGLRDSFEVYCASYGIGPDHRNPDFHMWDGFDSARIAARLRSRAKPAPRLESRLYQLWKASEQGPEVLMWTMGDWQAAVLSLKAHMAWNPRQRFWLVEQPTGRRFHAELPTLGIRRDLWLGLA